MDKGQSPTNEVDLFLLGKTGAGKSSTGNSIMGSKKAFKVSSNATSETFNVQMKWCRRLDTEIKVVDGPGLCETRMEKGKAAKKMSDEMTEAVVQVCPQGFHALVLVLRYGSRFTEEENNTVETLKSVFGPTFVRDFCILIFSHGENFDDDFESEDGEHNTKTFSEWCNEQEGPLQKLLQDCQNRAVLFYNKTKDQDKSDLQLQELLNLVNVIKAKNGGNRYTNEAFEKAAEEREKAIVRENAPLLREAIQKKVNFLIESVDKMKAKRDLSDEVFNQLQQLAKDTDNLLDEITKQDKGTGVLDSSKQVVIRILYSVQSYEEVFREKKRTDEMKKDMEKMKLESGALKHANTEMKKKVDTVEQSSKDLKQTNERMEDTMKRLKQQQEVAIRNMEKDASELRSQLDEANKKDGVFTKILKGVGETVATVGTLGMYQVAKRFAE